MSFFRLWTIPKSDLRQEESTWIDVTTEENDSRRRFPVRAPLTWNVNGQPSFIKVEFE